MNEVLINYEIPFNFNYNLEKKFLFYQPKIVIIFKKLLLIKNKI